MISLQKVRCIHCGEETTLVHREEVIFPTDMNISMYEVKESEMNEEPMEIEHTVFNILQCVTCEEYYITYKKENPRILYGYSNNYAKRLFLDSTREEAVIYPISDKDYDDNRIPDFYRNELSDIYKILDINYNASALLSRRLLERFIKDEYNIKKRKLEAMITELLDRNHMPDYMKISLDHVRLFGNKAAHEVSVTKEQSRYLAAVIKQLFDFAFVQPAITAEMEAMLKGDKANQENNSNDEPDNTNPD